MRISLRAMTLSFATACLFAAGAASAGSSYTINLGSFQGEYADEAVALAKSELSQACLANGDTPGEVTIHRVLPGGEEFLFFAEATIVCHRN